MLNLFCLFVCLFVYFFIHKRFHTHTHNKRGKEKARKNTLWQKKKTIRLHPNRLDVVEKTKRK